jgi:hypothetical protein
MALAGQIQERRIGHRKAALMNKVYTKLNHMATKGMNPGQVAKFLKIDIRNLHTKYTTKQLTGVLSQLREFELA